MVRIAGNVRGIVSMRNASVAACAAASGLPLSRDLDEASFHPPNWSEQLWKENARLMKLVAI